MGAVAGYVSNTPLEPEAIHSMLRVLSHRGIAEQISSNTEALTLGCACANTTDYAEFETSSPYIVAIDGRIYNYDDLRRERALSLEYSNQIAIVRHCIETMGNHAFAEYNGAFSCMYYNKHSRILHLVSDQFASKPLYYYWDNKNFAFASEIKALLQLSFVQANRQHNIHAVRNYLYAGYAGTEDTFYTHIYKVPPGTIIAFDGERIEKSTYFSLPALIQNNTITDSLQAKEILRDALEQSVRYRLQPNENQAVFLSGGIDSALVAALAQRNSTTALSTFTLSFPHSSFDESAHARKVAQYLHTQHYELQANAQQTLDAIHALLTVYDEPFADSSAIPSMLLSHFAASQGVESILMGDGADELFLGYGMHVWAQRLANPLLFALRYPLSHVAACGNTRMKELSKLLQIPHKQQLHTHIFSQEQGYFTQKEILKLIGSSSNAPYFTADEYMYSRKLSAAELQAIHDLTKYVPGDLSIKIERAASYNSCMIHSPFFDTAVVTHALNVNQNLKINSAIQKYILKELLYDYIPHEYFQHKKQGFSMPLQEWLHSTYTDLVHEYLNESAIQSVGLLSYKEVKKLTDRYMHQQQLQLYQRVWSLIVLQKFFMEQF